MERDTYLSQLHTTIVECFCHGFDVCYFGFWNIHFSVRRDGLSVKSQLICRKFELKCKLGFCQSVSVCVCVSLVPLLKILHNLLCVKCKKEWKKRESSLCKLCIWSSQGWCIHHGQDMNVKISFFFLIKTDENS